MDTKRVAPERTDVISHVGNRPASGPRNTMNHREPRKKRPERSNEDLIFGVFTKSMIGYISLGISFLVSLIFGVKELGMSIPVYIIVLIICIVMGFLLSNAYGFISVLISAVLLIIGAILSLFPAVALGVALLMGTSLIIRGA